MTSQEKKVSPPSFDNPRAVVNRSMIREFNLLDYENMDHCRVCGQLAGAQATLRRCSTCKEKDVTQPALYCSPGCQRCDWPEHKIICGTNKENPSYWDDVGYAVRIPELNKDQRALQDWTHVYRRALMWTVRQAFAMNPSKKPPRDILILELHLLRRDTSNLMVPFPIFFKFHKLSPGRVFSAKAAAVHEFVTCEVRYFTEGGKLPDAVTCVSIPLEKCRQDTHFAKYKNFTKQQICLQWPWLFYQLCAQSEKNSFTDDMLMDRWLGRIETMNMRKDRPLAKFIVPPSLGAGEEPWMIPYQIEWLALLRTYEKIERIKWDPAVRDFLVRSPADAKEVVKLLRSNPEDTDTREHAAISYHKNTWEYMWDAGYQDFMIEQAGRCGDKEIPASRLPRWQQSANELAFAIHIIQGVLQSNYTEKHIKILCLLRKTVRDKVLSAILSSHPKIGLPILISRAQACGWVDSEEVRSCMYASGHLMFMMSGSLMRVPDPSFRKQFEVSGRVEIAMLCWFYGDEKVRSLGMLSLVASLRDPDSAQNALKILERAVTMEDIATKCKDMLLDGILSRPQLPAGTQEFELRLVLLLLSIRGVSPASGSALAAAFIKSNMHGLAFTLVKQLLGRRIVEWPVLRVRGTLLRSLVHNSSRPTALFVEYVERFGLVELLSRIITDGSFSDNPDEEPWLEVLLMVHHFVICSNSDCYWPASDESIKVVHDALAHNLLWRNTTTKFLDSAPPKNSEKPHDVKMRTMMQYWVGIGVLVKLKESQQLAAMYVFEGCQRKECKHHIKTGEEIDRMLFKCSKCQKVSYCSKKCQSEDWDAEHQHACAILANCQ